MPDVVRFALDSERELYVPGLGRFSEGILDIPAGNSALLARARYLLAPYRAVELGVVDETTPYPDLPALGPGEELEDPYPQYTTPEEIVNDPLVRSAFVPSDRLILSPIEPINPAPGTVWINTAI
jgi:hypothetical protein